MTVKQLIHTLSRPDVDPEAEVMIDAPMACSRNPKDRDREGDHLSLPVGNVEAGKFPDIPVNTHMRGVPWVKIIGTEVWDLPCDNKLTDRSIK